MIILGLVFPAVEAIFENLLMNRLSQCFHCVREISSKSFECLVKVLYPVGNGLFLSLSYTEEKNSQFQKYENILINAYNKYHKDSLMLKIYNSHQFFATITR